MVAALKMKEAMFCSKSRKELGFVTRFDKVPLYLYNSSAIHVAANRTYSPRARFVALRYSFVQELVKDGQISTHYLKTENQLADIGTKHLSKHRHRYLLKLVNKFIA